MSQEVPPLLPINQRTRPSPSGGRLGLKPWHWILLVALLGLIFMTTSVFSEYWTRVTSNRIFAARSQITSLGLALDMFEVDSGYYPAALQDLVRAPTMATNWHGPYIKEVIPRDPWGREYIYQYPGTHTNKSIAFDLYSRGPRGSTNIIANWNLNNRQ